MTQTIAKIAPETRPIKASRPIVFSVSLLICSLEEASFKSAFGKEDDSEKTNLKLLQPQQQTHHFGSMLN